MGSVNKVILVGNLGRDAELRYTPGGAAVATLNMATTEVWNDKGGQRQEKIAQADDQAGENAAQRLHKGCMGGQYAVRHAGPPRPVNKPPDPALRRLVVRRVLSASARLGSGFLRCVVNGAQWKGFNPLCAACRRG